MAENPISKSTEYDPWEQFAHPIFISDDTLEENPATPEDDALIFGLLDAIEADDDPCLIPPEPPIALLEARIVEGSLVKNVEEQEDRESHPQRRHQ